MSVHSIFNDVLGPVMSGPSSSHSAGCARIGLMVRMLFGKDIRKADVVFDQNGSYPSTYIGQGSDFGFAGGLMGYQTDNPNMKDAVKIAAAEGREIAFRQEPLSGRHPNEARIDVYDSVGQIALSALTFSTGGGMFEIVELNGFKVYIDGARPKAYLCCDIKMETEIQELIKNNSSKVTVSTLADKTLFCFEQYNDLELEMILSLRTCPGAYWSCRAPAVLPVPMQDDPKFIFSNTDEALRYAEEMHKELWELAIDYECSIGKITRDGVWQLARDTLHIMKKATIPPDPEKTEQFGFLPYQCSDLEKKQKLVVSANAGFLNRAALYAIAVMENSCAHNIVAAAPTAGSSGVIPAAILALGEEMGATEAQMVHGLLAAGAAGAFIANQATFGAEMAACQAENGAASAMAAAGIVQMLGGNVHQALMAASLSLQNMLGLICDPVAGLTQIPCISRNVAAVSNAVMSANMVLWGFDAVIPFDETIQTMFQVGQMLPEDLRCTCRGGLCKTETAKRLAELQKEKTKDLLPVRL